MIFASGQLFAFPHDPVTVECIVLTLRVVALALPLLVVFGVGMGYVLGRHRGPWISLLDFVLTLPLIFPPIATGFLLLLLLGRRGPIGSWLKSAWDIELIFSFGGVVIAAVVAGLPLITKQVQAAVRKETGSLIEQAQVLGKGPATILFRVVLPSLRRSVVIGLSLAFARVLGEVGITLMLGGNINGRTNTISLEIYNAVFTGEYDRALTLVAVLGGVSLVVLLVSRWVAADV